MNFKIGPYWYHDKSFVQKVWFRQGHVVRNFIVGIASAYDAGGLIGPENNGIFILDDDQQQILLDRDTEEGTGYFGPSRRQIERFKQVVDMTWDEFRRFVNSNERSRYQI